MPHFMDVHSEEDDVTPKMLDDVYRGVQHREGVTVRDVWADHGTGTVFCWSEATSPEAVQRLHDRAGHPVDRVHEVPVDA